MIVRRTALWMILLMLTTTTGVGSYAYWFWTRSDEMLTQTLRDQFAEKVPHWNVEFSRARFDWDRRVRVYNLILRGDGKGSPIIRVPELVLTLDREKLAERQEIIVHNIRLVSPTIELTRTLEGEWNWSSLLPWPKPSPETPVAEVEIEGGALRLRLDQPGQSEAAEIVLQQISGQFVPAGMKQFTFKASAVVEKAGNLSVSGEWNLDSQSAALQGSLKDVHSSGEFLSLVASTSAGLRERLRLLENSLQKYSRGGDADIPNELPLDTRNKKGPIASNVGEDSKTAVEKARIPNFGVSASLDIEFRISLAKFGTPPDFKFLVTASNGQVANPALPFALHDVDALVYWDNQRVVLRSLTAKNGVTRLELRGQATRQKEITPAEFSLAVKNLPVDRRVRARMPAVWQRVFDSLKPSGIIDVSGSMNYDGRAKWTPGNLEVQIHDGECTHAKFPYPVRGIKGWVKQAGKVMEVSCEGLAGRQPVQIRGRVEDPGPASDMKFLILSQAVPVDETLLSACRPDVQNALRELNLKGSLDVRYAIHVHRDRALPPDWTLEAQVRDGSLQYQSFPLRLTDLRGSATFDSREGIWYFRNVHAADGAAGVAASGTFDLRPTRNLLQLSIQAKGIPLDQQLRTALPPNLRSFWDDISPTGRLNLAAHVQWTPGKPVNIVMPQIELFGGSVMLRSFPLGFDEVSAKFSYGNDRVEIHSFTGRHDETVVRANGYIAYVDSGEWKLRLDRLDMDDLVPDRTFRRALPVDLRSIVEEIDPVGPVSFTGMLELRGTGSKEDNITAAWDMRAVLAGNSLRTGIDLKAVHGTVSSRGTWDGKQAILRGKLDLDSLTIWGHQLSQVRGPFEMIGNELVCGSREIVFSDNENGLRRPVPASERVTGRIVGGTVTLDMQALLEKEATYRARISLNRANLEEYALRYLKSVNNLRGVVNGWLDIRGRGVDTRNLVGKGQLQISPAALYELPVLAQVFKVISFVPPDRTAFTYALVDFNVANAQFLFNSIDLVGDAISLRGRGVARLDGRLSLDFYSTLAKNRQIPVPILSQLVRSATSGWVGVEVRGRVNAPIARVKAAPQLDDALKRFLSTFDPRPTQVPRLLPAIPPLGSAPPPQRTPTFLDSVERPAPAPAPVRTRQ